jgi:hypothetical protein
MRRIPMPKDASDDARYVLIESGLEVPSLMHAQREIPPGLSKRDVKILKSVKRRAHYLDKGFSMCGMRFGWTFIIGASHWLKCGMS